MPDTLTANFGDGEVEGSRSLWRNFRGRDWMGSETIKEFFCFA